MAEKEYQELTQKIDSLKKLVISGMKEVLTLDECIAFTGLSRDHLYRLTSKRLIPFYKPMGGHIYFKKSELENWLLQGRKETQAETDSRATTYCVTH